MKNRYQIAFCFVVCFCILAVSCFAPGSYPYAEEYSVNADEKDLINAVDFFKNDNPRYVVPQKVGVPDGKTNPGDHWYNIYFYYPEENQIVFTWVRSEGKSKATFALVGINNGLTLGHWKTINDDYSRAENAEQKRKFEDRILKKVKEILKLKKNR